MISFGLGGRETGQNEVFPTDPCPGELQQLCQAPGRTVWKSFPSLSFSQETWEVNVHSQGGGLCAGTRPLLQYNLLLFQDTNKCQDTGLAGARGI